MIFDFCGACFAFPVSDTYLKSRSKYSNDKHIMRNTNFKSMRQAPAVSKLSISIDALKSLRCSAYSAVARDFASPLTNSDFYVTGLGPE